MILPVTPPCHGRAATAEPALVLASASRYRRALLERLGVTFRCRAAGVDEAPIDGATPERRARRRARAKAEAVAADEAAPALVLGCDQVAALDGICLDKPVTRERAEAQLAAASGRCIELYSAVHAQPVGIPGPAAGVCVQARVHLRRLDDEAIRRYVATDEPLDCAGAFRIDGRGPLIMERVECHDPGAIVGLPLIAVAGLLRRFGIDPLRG